MRWEPQAISMWVKAFITYLFIGWCTQLPGGIFYRCYLPLRLLGEGYKRHGIRIVLKTPVGWIPFTILLWPVPFLRAGLNLIAVELVMVGILSSVVLIGYVTSLLGAVLVVIIAGLVSIYLARPRKPRFRSDKDTEEEARKLRVDAGKDRILGQFDAAHMKYKRAYELYVTLGDKDAQCNVLCSLTETTPRRHEIGKYVEMIEAVCASMSDPEERSKCLRNLDALKQRLKDSRGWSP